MLNWRTKIEVSATCACVGLAGAQTPLDSNFTFQGRLLENGQPANGQYDLIINAWDAAENGNLLNSPGASFPNMLITNGLFTVNVSLPASAVYGEQIWIGTLTRPGASEGIYTVLGARQPLTVTPHALYAGRTAQWQSVGGRTTNAVLGEFVGVNRSTRVGSAEFFGVQAPVPSGYGGMYLRTAGGDPFYGYSSGPRAVWTYFDASTAHWRVNNIGDRLTVTDSGRVGVGVLSPAGRLHVDGAGLVDGVFSTNTGSGRAAQFHLPAGASGDALYARTNGGGKAALFESHVANSTPALTAFKNGGGTAISADGDLEVDGVLRGKCGSATVRLTPIAYARFTASYEPLAVIAASPNVTVTPSSPWATVYIDDESDPSSWIVLANLSFEDPTLDNLGSFDELQIFFANDNSQPFIRINEDCYLRDFDACWDAGLPVGQQYYDVVVYKPGN